MKRKILSIALSFSMIASIFSSPVSAKADINESEVKGTTYYISTIDGNDNNNGLSENRAFYSLQKVNEIEIDYSPGILYGAPTQTFRVPVEH